MVIVIFKYGGINPIRAPVEKKAFKSLNRRALGRRYLYPFFFIQTHYAFPQLAEGLATR